MSQKYDQYLNDHRANVRKGFEWLREKCPEIFKKDEPYEWQICMNHDTSKNDPEEYDAYDKYFYGGNKSYAVVNNFNKAWLHHIHMNPHHWQHWVLINDDPGKGYKILDMPHVYIIEMICDWWSFSWNKGDLYEIFDWYDEHKAYIKFSDYTRKTVEDILGTIKLKLEDVE